MKILFQISIIAYVLDISLWKGPYSKHISRNLFRYQVSPLEKHRFEGGMIKILHECTFIRQTIRLIFRTC